MGGPANTTTPDTCLRDGLIHRQGASFLPHSRCPHLLVLSKLLGYQRFQGIWLLPPKLLFLLKVGSNCPIHYGLPWWLPWYLEKNAITRIYTWKKYFLITALLRYDLYAIKIDPFKVTIFLKSTFWFLWVINMVALNSWLLFGREVFCDRSTVCCPSADHLFTGMASCFGQALLID